MTHRDRASDPPEGESVRASESLDDVPHRLRLPSCPPVGPTHRLPDLYGLLSALLGISKAFLGKVRKCSTSDASPTAHGAMLRPSHWC